MFVRTSGSHCLRVLLLLLLLQGCSSMMVHRDGQRLLLLLSSIGRAQSKAIAVGHKRRLLLLLRWRIRPGRTLLAVIVMLFSMQLLLLLLVAPISRLLVLIGHGCRRQAE